MEMKIQVIRSVRKTLSLEVSREGYVVVRAPKQMPDEAIQWYVREHSEWLSGQIQRVKNEREMLRVEGKFTTEEIEKMVRLARTVIPAKVAYYARLMHVSYERISIRKQKSRWGSCSRNGNLSFNCLLMMTPPEVLDYIVVHELCHRLEMNHSSRFWAQVGKVMPDYRKHERWLKEHGRRLMLRMHGEDEI